MIFRIRFYKSPLSNSYIELSELQSIKPRQIKLLQENAIPIDQNSLNNEILESEGILFKFVNNKCYLTTSGLNVYRSIEKHLIEIISNDKILPSKLKKETVDSIMISIPLKYKKDVIFKFP